MQDEVCSQSAYTVLRTVFQCEEILRSTVEIAYDKHSQVDYIFLFGDINFDFIRIEYRLLDAFICSKHPERKKIRRKPTRYKLNFVCLIYNYLGKTHTQNFNEQLNMVYLQKNTHFDLKLWDNKFHINLNLINLFGKKSVWVESTVKIIFDMN